MDVGFHFNFGLGWEGRGLVSGYLLLGEGGGGGLLFDNFFFLVGGSFFFYFIFKFFENLIL